MYEACETKDSQKPFPWTLHTTSKAKSLKHLKLMDAIMFKNETLHCHVHRQELAYCFSRVSKRS